MKPFLLLPLAAAACAVAMAMAMATADGVVEFEVEEGFAGASRQDPALVLPSRLALAWYGLSRRKVHSLDRDRVVAEKLRRRS